MEKTRQGFLLSPSGLRILQFALNYSYFYRVMPFKWSKGAEFIVYSKLCWSSFGRYWTLHGIILYEIFMIYRSFHSLLNINFATLRVFVIEGLFLGTFTLLLAFQFSIIHRGRIYSQVLNQFMHYYQLLQQTYGAHHPNPPPFQKEVIVISVLFLQAALVSPIMVLILCIRNPDASYFPTSLLIKDAIAYPLWIRFLLALPTVWLFASNWACLLGYSLMGFTPVFPTIFLLNELRPGKKSPYTHSSIRDPKNLVPIYRNLQLLLQGYNAVTKDYILMIVTNFCAGFTLWCNFIVIRFHSDLSIESIAMSLVVSFSSSLALIIIYIKMGEINEMSKRLLDSWLRYPGTTHLVPKLGNRDLLLLKKSVKSCPLLHLDVGQFGYYTRSVGVRMLGKLVTYNAKFIIIMNKIV